MPDFREVLFPPDIAYGAVGGPEYRTTVVVTASGREQRNSAWAQARGRWNVASGLKSRAQLAALIAFLRARKGRSYGFSFKDWTDYQATGQPLGTGNGATTSFQLVKRYPSGSELRAAPSPSPSPAPSGSIGMASRRPPAGRSAPRPASYPSRLPQPPEWSSRPTSSSTCPLQNPSR